ncbi:FAD-dependent oxidoreductase [Lysobacter sp. TY2-98]|uniref:NAD(P)/FAD-dependent oxidoreductase n=1 Tax=Lysobacter sp. TY2-98 TaxID=2290922 RepID=UPI000E200F72|nr:tryptophan 7-halogenase [Lysobacter sp. TY2-98]AXK73051.1 FAD-dependent oxidoreductase [Lysobacter sp. TY2-98]
MDTTIDSDVVILGGGLAGLTLALQLKRRDDSLRITVLERHRHPVREGAFKVGESTVEIGGHYFAHVLGLREHLDSAQIRKFGFRFFFSDGEFELDRCTELGVSRLLPTISWQIDRGRFENFLTDHVRAQGIDVRDGAIVRNFDLATDGAPHSVRYECDGATHELTARWVVDASGRAGLIKRKLDLAETNAHNANSAWWRVSGLLDPRDWSIDPDWLGRCTPPDRWRSTNHMCGEGYWFWLIPLSSNQHSVGIVCDGDLHPLETMNTHAKAMDWLHRHQPRVAAMLESGTHELQDFMFMRHFSHGAKQVFSGDRWALTGEAGVFLDPFYSPGSDFIAISNTYITEMILADRARKPITAMASLYQQLYFSFYENTMTLYQDQYRLFGDAQVMPLKVIWDYTYYWSLLGPLFFSGYLTSPQVLGQLRALFGEARTLNLGMQALLRRWGELNAARGDTAPLDGRLLDQYKIPWFYELNRQLGDPLEPDAFVARMRSDIARMHDLAAEMLLHGRREHPTLGDAGLELVLGGHPAPAEPLLSPVWYAEAATADAAA